MIASSRLAHLVLIGERFLCKAVSLGDLGDCRVEMLVRWAGMAVEDGEAFIIERKFACHPSCCPYTHLESL